MLDFKELKQGDTVWVSSGFIQEQDEPILVECNVVRVGRQYFYLYYEGREVQVNRMTGKLSHMIGRWAWRNPEDYKRL